MHTQTTLWPTAIERAAWSETDWDANPNVLILVDASSQRLKDALKDLADYLPWALDHLSMPYARILACVKDPDPFFAGELDTVEEAAHLAKEVASVFAYAASRVRMARLHDLAGGES